ncbi:MAG: ATP-dependent helicase [Nanobdellota archaeon]
MVYYKEQPESKEDLLNILNPTVKEWFFSKFADFSLPQRYGVMEIHSRNNVLVSAPTGATKTLTGFLSVINELVDSAEKGKLEDKVYCVYVSPLKALNEDIRHNLLKPLEEISRIAGRDLGIRVGVRTGDTSQAEKSKMLKNPPHILITTPESLAILLSTAKFKDNMKGVEWCIVDEVHSLAENKRGVHLSLSLERLSRLSSYVTRVGLSATVAPLEEIGKYLAGYENGEERDCKIIDVQFIKELDLKVLSPVSDLIDTSHGQMHEKMYEQIHDLISSHKTTLIFTNTRSATERVVSNLKEKYPGHYGENIGAHHGSLAKEIRHDVEKRMRNGDIKVVVSSTSLELGIDIGNIDLVILLGSPKSVARAIQRCGRAGHQLHKKTKGRIMVLERDDLVECSVMMRDAMNKKIDRIHIPGNCLDVLAQQIYGIAIGGRISYDELLAMVRGSYNFRDLEEKDFKQVVDYLAGVYSSLEDRHVYAKIWHNEGMIGKRGKMARVLYMTNIGTIPDETFVKVKIGENIVGHIDEGFLEKLKRGDVFVLGGAKYEFLYARGMTAQVRATVDRPPTIPNWVSEMLPLSFDLAMNIQRFRRLVNEKFDYKLSKKEIMDFIHDYLYVDKNAADSLYRYFKEQYNYSLIPHDKRIVIEHFVDENTRMIVFHTLFGRRVNDCLSRAVAFAVSRIEHKDMEIGISDNGFYLRSHKKVNIMRAVKMLRSDKLELLLKAAIDKTEVLKRRFRHTATRALMILRNYRGKSKKVGRQQVSSMILMNALKRIDPDFSILKEARREVLEDLMDIESTRKVLKMIENGEMKIEEVNNPVPSPFSFKMVLQGHTDYMRIEDKVDFLRNMHKMVLAKISTKKGVTKEDFSEFDYHEQWEKEEKEKFDEVKEKEHELKLQAGNLSLPAYIKEELFELIEGGEMREDVAEELEGMKDKIEEEWPEAIRQFVFEKIFK